MNTNFHLSSYVNIYKNDNLVALYNNSNREVAYLHNNAFEKIKLYLNKEELKADNDETDLNEVFYTNLSSLKSKKIIIDDQINENEQFYNYCRKKKDLLNKSKVQVLYIFPTLKCNFNCKYCVIEKNLKDEQKNKVMDIATAKKGIDLFFNNTNINHPITVIFYGGEPFIYKELFKEIIEYIDVKQKELKINKITISVNTNGSLIDEDLALFLSKRKNIFLGISLDGCEEDNDKMRIYHDGRGTYKDIVKGINICREYNVNFSFSFTIGSHNIDRLKDNVKYVLDTFRINSIGFNFMHDFEAGDNPGQYPDGYNSVLDIIIETGHYLFAEKGIMEDKTFVRRWNIFNDKTMNGCYLTDCAGMGNQIVLSPSGKIGPCHAFIGSEKYFLPLEDAQMDINNHPVWKEWKKCSPVAKEKCIEKKCLNIDICGGGCPYMADVRNNSIHSIDEDACSYLEKLKEKYVWIRYDLLKKQVEKKGSW